MLAKAASGALCKKHENYKQISSFWQDTKLYTKITKINIICNIILQLVY